MPAISRSKSLFAIAIVALSAACGSSTEPKKDVTPATITAQSTDTIRATVGAAVSTPLTVTVKNAAGEPIDTATVTFAVVTGGGTLSATTVKTNASGQASTTWTLGKTPGIQTATATVGALPSITFPAVAAVGSASAIAKVTGDAQTATVGGTVSVAPSVRLTDSFGNPVPNVLVTFTVGSGGGAVTAGSANTDATGVAKVGSWRLGTTVGTNTLVATAGALTTTFTATGVVGAAASITLTPLGPVELDIGQTVALTARVVDASGNVLVNPAVTYTSSNLAAATVSTTGGVTAVGPGAATITAALGGVSQIFNVTVIGHPSGTSISNTIQLGGSVPGDVAFTKDLTLAATGVSVTVFDPTVTSVSSTIPLTTPVSLLVAPRKAAGPAIAVNVGTTSRLWFIDPTLTGTSAVIDSLDIAEIITSAAMTSDGTRAFMMLSNGELSVVDGATHRQITRVTLGGGITRMRLAPGDSLLYAFTTVGVIFEIDARTNTVKRQIIQNFPTTDFALSRDGTLFYILDGTGSLVRIVSVANSTVQRSVGVSPNATSISLSPDDRQIWLTHNNPQMVSIYTGSPTTGYLSSGSFTTQFTNPLRVYFNFTGSIAAITNNGGWVDIVR
jgi:hypothetical protein